MTEFNLTTTKQELLISLETSNKKTKFTLLILNGQLGIEHLNGLLARLAAKTTVNIKLIGAVQSALRIFLLKTKKDSQK